MSGIYTLKNTFVENRIFLNRVVAGFILILFLTGGLIVRLVYLQIIGHEDYATRAKDNRIKLAPIPPTRGIIYDRKGVVLAENLPSYSLELTLEQIKDLDDTLLRLQKLLNISDEEIAQYHKLRHRHKRFASVPLLMHMSDEEVAKFAVVRPYFPGVDIQARLVRHYPFKDVSSHVIGYVGRINEQELKNLPNNQYEGTHHIGKNGIEQSYEAILHGQVGYMEKETNAQGRTINILDRVDPTPGANLYLSLDIELQKIAYDALGDYNGAVVAIDVETGGVLVFASRPGFDPNPFVYGISHDAYQALQTSSDRPLFNRALRGQYPPGSTIKPFIGLAGLEYKAVNFNQTIYCPGHYQLPNSEHKYRDWKSWGHGTVNLKQAITQSCDVYFYDLALALGIDNIHAFLSQFGFGDKTNIDLNGEKPGLLPSQEWKQRKKNQPWYPGETLITGIGQGFTLVTPVQLATATAILAKRGKVISPFLVDRIIDRNSTRPKPDKKEEKITLKVQNTNDIIQAMINVVHGERGTAKRISHHKDYQIAGKTGTAQVFTIKQEEKYNEEEIQRKLRDHALFIAFAPAKAAKIAVAVIVENGGHGGSVAAPIAEKVIERYLKDHKDGK